MYFTIIGSGWQKREHCPQIALAAKHSARAAMHKGMEHSKSTEYLSRPYQNLSCRGGP